MRCGIQADEHDYGQTLFVARVAAERAPDGTAYERFGAHGPIALLPRADRHFGVVHGCRRRRCGCVSRHWTTRRSLRTCSRHSAGAPGASSPSARAAGIRPSSLRARDLVADALGAGRQRRADAASGRCAGLQPRPARCTDAGRTDRRNGRTIPARRDLLAAYAQRRSDDRERTLAFSDGLARATANQALLMRPLRSLGLLALDASPSLQSALAGGAMGYRGDVPALCRVAMNRRRDPAGCRDRRRRRRRHHRRAAAGGPRAAGRPRGGRIAAALAGRSSRPARVRVRAGQRCLPRSPGRMARHPRRACAALPPHARVGRGGRR